MPESMPLGTLVPAFLETLFRNLFYNWLKFVAVAGGVVFGWLVAGPLVRLLVRLAFHRDTPRLVVSLSRLGGAALVGFIVYLLPIGLGGSGWGLGGGDGPGSGKGKGAGEVRTADRDRKAPADQRDRTSREKTPPEAPRPDVLSVRILGGEAVKEDRYYEVKVNGKDTPLTVEGVRKILAEDKAKRIKRVEIIIDPDSVPETSPVVTELEKLAREHNLPRRVIKIKPGRAASP
jgi:hypothetical protein